MVTIIEIAKAKRYKHRTYKKSYNNIKQITTMKKYSYFHVATPQVAENFGNYQDALRFYGKSEKPSTLYGVKEDEGFGDDYACIKSK